MSRQKYAPYLYIYLFFKHLTICHADCHRMTPPDVRFCTVCEKDEERRAARGHETRRPEAAASAQRDGSAKRGARLPRKVRERERAKSGRKGAASAETQKPLPYAGSLRRNSFRPAYVAVSDATYVGNGLAASPHHSISRPTSSLCVIRSASHATSHRFEQPATALQRVFTRKMPMPPASAFLEGNPQGPNAG